MSEESADIPAVPVFNLSELLPTTARPLTAHPAIVYLAGLSEGSRRTIFLALNTIAAFLSDGQLSVFELEWSALRYEHTAAIRVFLVERYKPATANRMLSALRQVLFHAWKLGYMSTEDYHRARAGANVRGEALSAGHDPDQK